MHALSLHLNIGGAVLLSDARLGFPPGRLSSSYMISYIIEGSESKCIRVFMLSFYLLCECFLSGMHSKVLCERQWDLIHALVIDLLCAQLVCG